MWLACVRVCRLWKLCWRTLVGALQCRMMSNVACSCAHGAGAFACPSIPAAQAYAHFMGSLKPCNDQGAVPCLRCAPKLHSGAHGRAEAFHCLPRPCVLALNHHLRACTSYPVHLRTAKTSVHAPIILVACSQPPPACVHLSSCVLAWPFAAPPPSTAPLTPAPLPRPPRQSCSRLRAWPAWAGCCATARARAAATRPPVNVVCVCVCACACVCARVPEAACCGVWQWGSRGVLVACLH